MGMTWRLYSSKTGNTSFQGQISTLALPRAKFLVGRVRHDLETPRAEGGLPPEG
jgi:hypothetical protein